MAAKKKSNYLIYLSILTIILMAIFYFVKDKFQLPLSAAYIIPAFYVITAISHTLLMRSINTNPRKFYTNFLAAMSFKMLAYLAVLSLILLIDGRITIEFVIAFFAVYVCYTTFEMAVILPMAKRNQP